MHDAPPVSQAARRASRISRLRWLPGSRTPGDEVWDAYEAPDGQALLDVEGAEDWSEVSIWLSDVADELVARHREESVDRIPSLERVWITGSGRGVLLDFPAPTTSRATEVSASTPSSAQQLLCGAAVLRWPFEWPASVDGL
ncbi:MAG: hypothetical protein U0163_00345 [Gemmatimonadaceae bacterium]